MYSVLRKLVELELRVFKLATKLFALLEVLLLVVLQGNTVVLVRDSEFVERMVNLPLSSPANLEPIVLPLHPVSLVL